MIVYVVIGLVGVGLIGFGMRPGPWLFDITDADIRNQPPPRRAPEPEIAPPRDERPRPTTVDWLAGKAAGRRVARAIRPLVPLTSPRG